MAEGAEHRGNYVRGALGISLAASPGSPCGRARPGDRPRYSSPRCLLSGGAEEEEAGGGSASYRHSYTRAPAGSWARGRPTLGCLCEAFPHMEKVLRPTGVWQKGIWELIATSDETGGLSGGVYGLRPATVMALQWRCIASADAVRMRRRRYKHVTPYRHREYRSRPSSPPAGRPFIVQVIPLGTRRPKLDFPLPLTGPYRLERTTLANRIAASRNYKHPWLPISFTGLATRHVPEISQAPLE